MDNFTTDYPIILLVVEALCYYFIVFRSYEFFSPVNLIALILLLFPIIGTLSLEIVQDELGWYKGVSGYDVNWHVGMATIASYCCIFMSRRIFRTVAGRSVVSEFDEDGSYKFILIGSMVFIAVNLVNFISLGYFPLFWEVDGDLRFKINNIIPIPKGLIFTSIFLCLNVIHLLTRQRHRWGNVSLLLVNFMISASIGSRFLTLFPMLTAVLFAFYVKKIKLRTFLWLAPVLVIGVVILRFVRKDATLLDAIIVADSFGGVYRDYILLIEYYSKYTYEHGATLLSIVVNMIPKQLFYLFGIQKESMQIYSAYVFEDIFGADTGIRLGIWGEGYINFGLPGMYGILMIYSVLVERLNSSIARCFDDYEKMLFMALFTGFAFFMIVASAATIGDFLGWYFIVFYMYSSLAIVKQSKVQL
jgi:hypothetical protein